MKHYNSYLYLMMLLITVTACKQETSPVSSVKSSPNILFIMSDDHTANAWGVNGGRLDSIIQNPHIRRLASEGALLRNSFCTNSICVPSRATILTGQYSHRNGVYTLQDTLKSEQDHVAKRLQKAGYQTALIGKWHLKDRPSGFDYYNVLPGQGRYNDPILRDSVNWESGGKAYSGFSADVIGDLTIDWLEHRDTTRPFFMMCHFKSTHEPFDYPDRHKALYENVEIPLPPGSLSKDPKASGRTFEGQVLEILTQRYVNDTAGNRYPDMPFSVEGLTEEEALKKTYQKFVKDFLRSGKAIDDNIGKILDHLDQAGLADNTVVIYTADQGYFLGEHGFFDKRMMYEEALEMPFVIRYPPEIEAGSTLDDIVLNTDYAPLFLDYASATVPDYMQGRSFRANLQGKTPPDWREFMYYRYWLHLIRRPAHLGIRTNRFKLIFFYGAPLNMTGADQESTAPAWEFYDLETDPHELNNAYDDPQYEEVITNLKDALKSSRDAVGDTDKGYPEMSNIIEQHWE